MRNGFRFFPAVFSALIALAAPAGATPSLLFDLTDGRVISHEEAFQRWFPASLTKLMTAYVTFRAIEAGELRLDSPIVMSKKAAKEPPSKSGFKPGTVLTADNALKLMLVRSNNDIAMALGENVGGSEAAFAERMNTEAARLGMTDSHFVNPNGLHSPQQYTTARDLALLVAALRRDFPQFMSYFSIEGVIVGKKTLTNFNLLVGRYDGVDGMKTGFVCPSGFNMIGTATRDGRTLGAIVLGQPSATVRAEAAAAMLDRGFANPKAGGDTLAMLSRYGYESAAPKDMRDIICPKPVKAEKPEKQPSEQAEEETKSPYAMPYDHPLTLVAVTTGGATGPVPKAYAEMLANNYADVPVPTPRPPYPEPTQAGVPAQQGDGN
ncbi:MAG: D-alanyl-D-alanine carboxypeptidase [Hyphomicrobiales bacterium]|nr:D-alanyl-D-alanine carboxypeptidase [Hyphomicrobiales bacterium]